MSVRLRPVEPSDLAFHFEQQRDAESSRMAAVAPRDRAAFDAHWKRILTDPTVVVRTVLWHDRVAGSVLSFVRAGQRQVGYWVARDHWGRGIATAALEGLLAELAERPLWARAAAHNPGSLRVLEKCGFRHVGDEDDDGTRIRVLRLG